MKLMIKIKCNIYKVKITVDNEIYYTELNQICVELKSSNPEMRIELVPKNRCNKKVKYKFCFHDKDSKDFFQHKKFFNSYAAVYRLKVHRDAEIVFNITESKLINSFDSNDIYYNLRVDRKSNLIIDKVFESQISKSDVKKVIIIDSILLVIRTIIAVGICVLCCYFAYYYRYEMKTIFQGEMIWVVDLGYVLFLALYLSSLISRNIKYFRNLLGLH